MKALWQGFDSEAVKAIRFALENGWEINRRSRREHILLKHTETGATHSISQKLSKRKGGAKANTYAKLRNPENPALRVRPA